jgi:hypothetical protein
LDSLEGLSARATVADARVVELGNCGILARALG